MTTLTDLLAHTPHDHVERKSLMNAQHQLEDLSRQMHDEVGLRPLRSSDFSSLPRQASAVSPWPASAAFDSVAHPLRPGASLLQPQPAAGLALTSPPSRASSEDAPVRDRARVHPR